MPPAPSAERISYDPRCVPAARAMQLADSSAEALGRRAETLRNQQYLARRLPALERAMRLGGILQRKLELGAQLELAGGDPTEEIARALLQLLAGRDVVH